MAPTQERTLAKAFGKNQTLERPRAEKGDPGLIEFRWVRWPQGGGQYERKQKKTTQGLKSEHQHAVAVGAGNCYNWIKWILYLNDVSEILFE